jgi:hypothetical protein
MMMADSHFFLLSPVPMATATIGTIRKGRLA